MSIKSQELVVRGVQLQIETLKNQIKILESQLHEENCELLKRKYLDCMARVPDKKIVELFTNGAFVGNIYKAGRYFKDKRRGTYYEQLWASYEWRQIDRPDDLLRSRLDGGSTEDHHGLLIDYFKGDKDAVRSLQALLITLSEHV
jgi:hypothetical protein